MLVVVNLLELLIYTKKKPGQPGLMSIWLRTDSSDRGHLRHRQPRKRL